MAAVIFSYVSSSFAAGKKTYIFPIVPLNSEIDFCGEYTDILKQKLEKSDVFKIFLAQDFNFTLKKDDIPDAALRRSVYNYCDIREIKSAIYGYITKEGSSYNIFIILYSAEDDNIIQRFNDHLVIKSEIYSSALDCAVDFVAGLNSIQSARYVTSSAFLPGLGQLEMKKYLKSTLIFGGFGFYLYKLISAGSFKSVEDDTEIRVVEINFSRRFIYLYKGNEVSRSFLETIPDEYNKYNHDLEKKRHRFQLFIGCIYLYNILDIIFSIKEYNDKLRIKKKLNVDVIPGDKNTTISLSYRF